MRLKKIEGINIVPFVDIILVLLVIVLMEATFVKTDGIILPPSMQGDGVSNTEKEVTFSITQDGVILLENKPIALDSLSNAIEQIDKTASISIQADSRSAFEKFVFLISALKEKGLQNINIITEKKKE